MYVIYNRRKDKKPVERGSLTPPSSGRSTFIRLPATKNNFQCRRISFLEDVFQLRCTLGPAMKFELSSLLNLSRSFSKFIKMCPKIWRCHLKKLARISIAQFLVNGIYRRIIISTYYWISLMSLWDFSRDVARGEGLTPHILHLSAFRQISSTKFIGDPAIGKK